MTSPTSVTPISFRMSQAETLPLTFDATAYLNTGQSVTNPVASLLQVGGKGTSATPTISPSISGNVVTQTITGPVDLPVLGIYRLRILFLASPGNAEWAMDLPITVTA